MTRNKLASVLESILFVAGDEVEIAAIADKLHIDRAELDDAIRILQARYDGESGVNLLVFNSKLQFASNPDYIEEVSAVLNPVREKELTKAMLETLAIIAYKQPITRIEVEELRGVDCTYAVQTLLKLDMITVLGRKDAIGKPLLFGTSDDFLKRFSLSSLDELPGYEELLDRIKVLGDVSDNLFDSNRTDVSQIHTAIDEAISNIAKSVEKPNLTLTADEPQANGTTTADITAMPHDEAAMANGVEYEDSSDTDGANDNGSTTLDMTAIPPDVASIEATAVSETDESQSSASSTKGEGATALAKNTQSGKERSHRAKGENGVNRKNDDLPMDIPDFLDGEFEIIE